MYTNNDGLCLGRGIVSMLKFESRSKTSAIDIAQIDKSTISLNRGISYHQ